MTATIETILLLLRRAGGRRRCRAAAQYRAIHSLVVAGIALALIPGLPRIELAPELVLLGILPPLIYSAGVAMSWREFRFNLRPITLFAFGCVIFTTCAVAAVAHFVLGMPLAVGFVLGAIVAPTDAVAPLAIVRRLGLPRRLLVVLEGEGLANDATALDPLPLCGRRRRHRRVLARRGRRHLRAHRRRRDRLRHRRRLGQPAAAPLGARSAGRDHAVADDALRRISGAGSIWADRACLATVAAGLFVSWNGPLLIPAATRLQGIFFWDLLVYLLEGFVFLVTGMQMRTLLDETIRSRCAISPWPCCSTVAVIVVARFVWVYPAIYLPRWLSPVAARAAIRCRPGSGPSCSASSACAASSRSPRRSPFR